MSKFEVGDRVRAKEDASVYLTRDKVYVIDNTKYDGQQVEVLSDTGRSAWLHSHRFELYAKAGEFVVGDRIIVTSSDKDADAPDGSMFTVTGTGRAFEERQCVSFTDNNGDGREWLSDRFRLATPEEIAAAEAKTVETILSPAAAAKWKLFVEMIDGINVFKPESGKTVFHHAGEIPAADFDFSTIKAGDEIVARLTISRDGIDRDGDVRTALTNGGSGYVSSAHIISVIPAPKPKTLRERAIEAAGEAWTATIGGQNVVDSIVDAVLAEVEKGR